MKKFAVMFTIALALGACHYGKKEAASSLERNKTYKEGKETGPEVKAEYVKGGPAKTDSTKVDSSTAKGLEQLHEEPSK